MPEIIAPDIELGKAIDVDAHAESCLCWTCSSCDLECPVNIATNRLRPQKIVRMANLGLLDELLHLPEIWYCLTCRRCDEVCPNIVKPATLIKYLRFEALRRLAVPYGTYLQYLALFSGFQRLRWHLAARCQSGQDISMMAADWRQWLGTTVQISGDKIVLADFAFVTRNIMKAADCSNLSACFTCRACSSACPVVCEGNVFDPVWIFRMVNLGLMEELLGSPSIWLCIGCKRCTETCTQSVNGHLIIRKLQDLAISEGVVDRDFPIRFQESGKALYSRFLDEIDILFGVYENR